MEGELNCLNERIKSEERQKGEKITSGESEMDQFIGDEDGER